MKELVKRLAAKMEKTHLLRRLYSQQITAGSAVHFGQMPILCYISEHDNCSQADLAAALCVTPASIATSTKRLQRAGFLTKEVDAENLRCKKLSITEQGRAAMEAHKLPFDALDRIMFAGLSEEELAQLGQLLDRINRNMSEALGESTSGESMLDLHKLIHRVHAFTEEEPEEHD